MCLNEGGALLPHIISLMKLNTMLSRPSVTFVSVCWRVSSMQTFSLSPDVFQGFHSIIQTPLFMMVTIINKRQTTVIKNHFVIYISNGLAAKESK